MAPNNTAFAVVSCHVILEINYNVLHGKVVVMGNTGFKFQLDWIHGLAARIISLFRSGFFLFLFLIVIIIFNKAHLVVPGWV